MQKEPFLRSTTPLNGLLAHIAQELRADFAYLYRVAEPTASAELVASSRSTETRAADHHGRNAAPDSDRVIIAQSAWSDPRLLPFRDIALDRIESAALIPVDVPFGRAVLAVGRRQPLSFDPCHVALFELISLGLSAVLCSLRQAEELSDVRAELERTREKLAGRKAIERAKGIIQARDACSEHEAYGHLRRLSRTTREPMSEIARRVIERSGAAVVEHKEILA